MTSDEIETASDRVCTLLLMLAVPKHRVARFVSYLQTHMFDPSTLTAAMVLAIRDGEFPERSEITRRTFPIDAMRVWMRVLEKYHAFNEVAVGDPAYDRLYAALKRQEALLLDEFQRDQRGVDDST